MRRLCVALCLSALAACTRTVPVAVIGANGETMKGTAVAAISGGSFTVSGPKGACHGTFDSTTRTDTVSFAVICDDGRRGVARAVRDSAESGAGLIEFSDGTKAKFVFGPHAEGF